VEACARANGGHSCGDFASGSSVYSLALHFGAFRPCTRDGVRYASDQSEPFSPSPEKSILLQFPSTRRCNHIRLNPKNIKNRHQKRRMADRPLHRLADMLNHRTLLGRGAALMGGLFGGLAARPGGAYGQMKPTAGNQVVSITQFADLVDATRFNDLPERIFKETRPRAPGSRSGRGRTGQAIPRL
jgi:hypothetical protein